MIREDADHLGCLAEVEAARKIVEAALDEGIRFFDNAESYHAGRSERFMRTARAKR